MLIEVVLPALGDGVEEVEVSYWYFKQNDVVLAGSDLVDVTTDKASISIPAPAGGVLKTINYKEGSKVKVGTVLALIEFG